MAGVGNVTYRVLDPTQPRKAADPIVGRVAQQLLHATQSRTPVRTGHLRAGWGVQHVKASLYVVGNPVRYARYVEHGTARMPAEPMIGPAVFALRARVS